MKRGSIIEVFGCMIFMAFVIIIMFSGGFACWNKYVHGNKTIIDLNYDFTYAYIDVGGKTEKVEIKTWKDWQDSDAIQVVGKDGKVYYTHLNRVILSNR